MYRLTLISTSAFVIDYPKGMWTGHMTCLYFGK